MQTVHSEVCRCAIARVCGILTVMSVMLASILSPLSPSQHLAFPAVYAAIIDDALRWLRQRDKAVNSFAYRSLFTASLSPDVNATAGGKISRRAIYRRNNA